MNKINYNLSAELCIYENLKKIIKELKIYSKNHPDSIVVNEQSAIPYLKQQIDCLKRSVSIYELHKLDGTLKTRRRILFYTFALGTLLTITSSPSKELEPLEVEEQSMPLEDLSEVLGNINNENIKYIQEQSKKEFERKKKEELAETIKAAKISECKKYIEEYCYYFNFDSEKVLDLARTLTNNFSTEIIITIGNKEVISTNPETMAMFLVWDLYKNSSDYNLTTEELTITDEISHLEYDDEGKIILRNGLYFSQFLGKVSDIIEGDKCFDLAVSNYETNFQTNPQSIEQNNFGGWRYDEEFLTFPSPEAGIIYHCIGLEKMRNSRDYNNLMEFSGIYVNNDKNLPAPSWEEDVSSKIAIYAKNERFYFDYENNPQNKKEGEIMLAMNLSE